MVMLPTSSDDQKFNVVTEAEQLFYNYMKGKSGPFNTALFETIFHADVCNMKALEQAFPEEVQVVKRYKTEQSYWSKLEKAIKEL